MQYKREEHRLLIISYNLYGILLFLIMIVTSSFAMSYRREYEQYSVELIGVSSLNNLQIMKGHSLLALNYNENYKSLSMLSRQAKEDADSLTLLLRSLGYLDAKVSASVDFTKNKPIVFLYVWEGNIYKIGIINIIYDNPEWINVSEIIDEVHDKASMFSGNSMASSAQISEIQSYVLNYMHNSGLPFASISDTRVTSDTRKKSVNISISVQSGPITYLGEPKITGLKDLSDNFIKQYITWKPGDRINKSILLDARNKLVRTGLFNDVDIQIPNINGAQESYYNVETIIDASEALSRSINLKGYVENSGLFFGSCDFSNKNIDRMGGRFSIGGKFAKYFGDIYASYTRSLLPSIIFSSSVVSAFKKIKSIFKLKEDELYATKKIEISSKVQLKPTEIYNASISVNYRIIEATLPDDYNGSSSIIGIPNTYHIIGIHPSLSVANIGVIQVKSGFAITSIDSHLYINVKSKNYWFQTSAKLVIHTNSFLNSLLFHTEIKISSIWTKNKDEVPIFDRLYLGGREGGKGYLFESISPYFKINEDEQPIGGFGALSYSLELWYLHNYGISFITFVDSAFCTNFPIFKMKNSPEKIFYSYGVGILYSSGKGDYIRFEICIPNSARRGIDSKWQAHVIVSNYSE